MRLDAEDPEEDEEIAQGIVETPADSVGSVAPPVRMPPNVVADGEEGVETAQGDG
jgi:hypothetical protein